MVGEGLRNQSGFVDLRVQGGDPQDAAGGDHQAEEGALLAVASVAPREQQDQ